MMYANYNGEHHLAAPKATGATCPQCDQPVIAKCGRIVVWHWAHHAADCDPWTEPESPWHRAWKTHAPPDRTEVTYTRNGVAHRADIVLPDGRVLELQHGYLSPVDIAAREHFYWRGLWLYDASRFADRVHYGARGFWWKHGAKSMATHRWPVWWDLGDELARVTLNVVNQTDPYGFITGSRVLGKVVERRPHSHLIAAIRGPS